MSKAEKMFNALYMKKTIYNNKNIEWNSYNYGVTFYGKTKTYEVSDNRQRAYNVSVEVTPKLHQAITEQMKELGWFE